MNTYNVTLISELLHTEAETVRRWIRNGKLKAVKNSNKTGNVVTEDDLYEFLNNNPKYHDVALASLAEQATTLSKKIASDSLYNYLCKVQDDNDLIAQLEKQIAENQEIIEKELNKIMRLQKQVSDLEIKTESLRSYLKHMSLHEE